MNFDESHGIWEHLQIFATSKKTFVSGHRTGLHPFLVVTSFFQFPSDQPDSLLELSKSQAAAKLTFPRRLTFVYRKRSIQCLIYQLNRQTLPFKIVARLPPRRLPLR